MLEGKQLYDQGRPLPVIRTILSGYEFYVIAQSLEERFGPGTFALYTPADKDDFLYGIQDLAREDLEKITEHIHSENLGIYRLIISVTKVSED